MLLNARKQLHMFFNGIRKFALTKPWVFFFVILFLIWLVPTLFFTYEANRMGLESKTVWDWLELLIIPIVLATAGILFNRSQRKTELEIAKRNRDEDISSAKQKEYFERKLASEKERQNTLNLYFDSISNLLLQHNLRNSENKDEVRSIARARTISTLQSLDGKRRGLLLHFLVESDLIGDSEIGAIINLENADLSNSEVGEVFWSNIILHKVNLRNANFAAAKLAGIYFAESDMQNANFSEARFRNCDLSNTNLENATLSDVFLHKINLNSVNLKGADLSRADLSEAILVGRNPPAGIVAILRGANLQGANLQGAVLYSADLSDANLDNIKLEGAKYNKLTKWPKDFDPNKYGAILEEELY